MKKNFCFSMFFIAMLLSADVVMARNVAETDTMVATVNDLQDSKDGDVITITVEGVSFDMVKVEGGTFIMGCTDERGCFNDDLPSHYVTISRDYYIGKYEVTQELYDAVMGENPSNWKGTNLPVENVSWNDAQLFCNELSRITGRAFSLPTEAEWEYAARGGNKSTSALYSGGFAINKLAWFSGNSGDQTHPVGQLRPNELGIYDMSGNVYELCQDWFGDYNSVSQTNPKGPSTGSSRVLRGGSYGSNVLYCRVSDRNGRTPGDRGSYIGFRVVLR